MSKIAIFFPGIGYHCDKPLLYYSRNIARELGYQNYRNVSYTYQAGNIRGNEEKMKEAYEALFLQAEAALTDIIWAEYDDVLFISKSIGTIIAASYAEKYGLKDARHILYTPLAQTYLFSPKHAIAFIGTADPWSNTDEIIRLSNANRIPLTVYDECNHSLECSDTLKNLETLTDVMQKTRDFCKEIH
ncbi:MAG: alpha/beta hydrolase [Lachnospiraceae bacterium]|nr:alpha/beta hydrolase [Lachnospiraceae bacterium]